MSARDGQRRVAHALALLAMLAAAAAPLAPAVAQLSEAPGATAPSQDAWRQEFEDLCGKTQDAMGFAPDELRKLVQRCDALRPALEGLAEPHRKIYLRRLQQCRDLYQFVLDTKAGG